MLDVGQQQLFLFWRQHTIIYNTLISVIIIKKSVVILVNQSFETNATAFLNISYELPGILVLSSNFHAVLS